MRDYGKISPQFWVGQTGKAIRAIGPECQVVALYLMSSPHANMIGLYYLPVVFVSHETGIPMEGASKALQSLCEVGFCSYDQDAEVVWVHEMARYQVGDSLKPADKRVIGIQNEIKKIPKNSCLHGWLTKYSESFSLSIHAEEAAPSEGPSKALRSQEQEQEQDSKKDSDESSPARIADCPHQQIIDAYEELLPMLPRVRRDMWSGSQAAESLKARWREDPKRRDVGWWRKLFERIRDRCPHLLGHSSANPNTGKVWHADLRWIVKRENFTKILEGRYLDKRAA